MVAAHKKRRETDKDLIMTMGVGRGGRQHPESPIMMVHPPSSRLLSYHVNPLSPRRQRVEFAANLFLDPWPATIDEYEIWSGTSASSARGGYRDLGIDVCEADVPALCTENFDYHDLRRHFVNGVLTSELLGKNINVHLVGDEEPQDKGTSGRYVERIRDTRTYGEISQDILRRWVFPLVPDMNVPGLTGYELRRGGVYVARDNVLLSRTTNLHGPVLVGARCTLGNYTRVTRSTLGARCSVGANTTIRMSYIFNNVRIGNDCKLEECMIGNSVTLGDGVVIGKGALIGDGVKIGAGVHVPAFAHIGRLPYKPDTYDSEDDDDATEEEAARSHSLQVLGSESVGFVWPTEEEEEPEDSDDEADDPYEHPKNKRLLQLGRPLSRDSTSTATLSTLSVASTTPPDSPISMASSASMDVANLNLDEGIPDAFYSEARSTLARALDEGHSVSNALLELKTLVMGYNSGIDAAREEVVNAIMGRISLDGGAGKILATSTELWERWAGMATGLSRDGSDIAMDVQTYCVRNSTFAPWFGLFLRALYDGDVVEEDALLKWRSLPAAQGEEAKASERETYKEVFAKGKQYVDVLEQMDSEDDEEDDSEDEE